MDYQQEVTKRLLKIKEIGRRAAEDKDLKNFKKEVFEDDGFTPKGLLTKDFLVPLLHLIQNPNKDSFAFWKLLHRWVCERNKIPLGNLSLEDITFIIQKLDSNKSKKSQTVLKKFKNFVLTNELLDKASPFITSDHVMHLASVPAFLTNEPDLTNFIDSYSRMLIKAIIFAFGIIEPIHISSGSKRTSEIGMANFPSQESIGILGRQKMLNGTKTNYKYIKDAVLEELDRAKVNHWDYSADHSSHVIKSYLNHFPTYADDKEIYDMQWSERSGISPHYHSYLCGLSFIHDLIHARESVFFGGGGEDISLEALALIIDSKNIKTIRNEFFKKDNMLMYADKTKTSVYSASANVWAMDAKRKQPIYLAISPKTLEDHDFPDFTLDYIMEL